MYRIFAIFFKFNREMPGIKSKIENYIGRRVVTSIFPNKKKEFYIGFWKFNFLFKIRHYKINLDSSRRPIQFCFGKPRFIEQVRTLKLELEIQFICTSTMASLGLMTPVATI